MFFQLASSTNCAKAGQPVTLTLVLTNTSSLPYIETLPVSVLDIQVKTETARRWRWSDTVAASQQLRSLSLQPNQSVTVAWTWVVDPSLRSTPPPRSFDVQAIFRYREPNGHIAELESGEYMGIPIDADSALGACP